MQNHTTTREEVANRVQDVMSSVKDSMLSAKDEASRRMSSFAKVVSGLIKDHPFATIAIGLSAGYLIAKLRSR